MKEAELLGRLFLEVLKYGLSAGALVTFGIVLAFLFPEKVEKWLALLFKVLAWVWKGAEKRFIRHDIQGRVNEFVKALGRKVPNFRPVGIAIEWLEAGESPDEFFSANRLVIRMKRRKCQDHNFVAASMVFIANAVVPKAKKYMAPYQREATDLHIGKALLESEKPGAVDYFFEEFFRPKVESNAKIAELVERYNVMDKVSVFFPLFIQEMSFLGEKVFYRPRNEVIVREVTELVNFLRAYADRPVGSYEVRLRFTGAYCRCGIMIVALRTKMLKGDIQPYVRRAQKLLENQIENIYMIGPDNPENVAFIDQIGSALEAQGLERRHQERYQAFVVVRDTRKAMPNYLVLYRSPRARRYFDEEYQAQYMQAEAATGEVAPVD